MKSNENAGRHPISSSMSVGWNDHSTARPPVCPREYNDITRIKIYDPATQNNNICVKYVRKIKSGEYSRTFVSLYKYDSEIVDNAVIKQRGAEAWCKPACTCFHEYTCMPMYNHEKNRERGTPKKSSGKNATTYFGWPLHSFDLTLRVSGSLIVFSHLLHSDLVIFLAAHGEYVRWVRCLRVRLQTMEKIRVMCTRNKTPCPRAASVSGEMPERAASSGENPRVKGGRKRGKEGETESNQSGVESVVYWRLWRE